jgi:protein O-GlcNAc transferase
MTAQQIKHRLNEAIAHHNAGRTDRAEAIYRQLLPFAPRAPIIFHLLGLLSEQQGRFDEAIRHYSQSVRLDPTAVNSAIRLSAVFIAQGRLADAESLLVAATQRQPKSHEAWNALAFAMKVRGNLLGAATCNQKSVELNPQYAEGWCQFGLTLGSMGKNEQALQRYDRALAVDPKCILARYGRAQSLHKTYRVDESIVEYDAFLRAQPDHLEAMSFRLFALQNSAALTREQLFAEHQAYGQAAGREAAMPIGHDLSPTRRLRVAVLSPDLRTHSCAYFLEPLLRHLHPTQFEIYLYHDHFVEDAMSARLRGLAAKWRNFVGQPHAFVEAAIRADKPDILIDLAGHIANTIRLPLFAKRLAPVQITYLGYPDTTGVTAMDFRFTDAVADPAGTADRYATEKLVRFAPTAWTYQPPSEAPAIPALPSTTSGAFTFGCFNSPTKFTDGAFDAWARLLHAVPKSRLVLKGRDFEESGVRDRLLRRMEARGIPVAAVELLPRTATTADHLAQYARVDVALDTFPYNGTTTTCEALWLGRPVVTLCGDRHASRVGASLLTAIGRPEWIAHDADDYVRIAAGLAADQAALANASAGLRDQMLRSPMLDHVGQSARFAAALRECWRVKVQTAGTHLEESTKPSIASASSDLGVKGRAPITSSTTA